MLFTRLPILALASLAAAQDSSSSGGNSSQSLNSTAGSNPQLSSFTALLGSDPALLETLLRAQNITVLAPSNEAISAFTNTTEGAMIKNNTGLMSALLRYHVLNGTFQASQITNQSAFIHTLLSNETYANVTGGQVVEAVRIGNKTVFYSGLLQNSTVVSADQNFTAGTIHIIDRVLTIPPSFLISALDLGLTSLYGAVNVSQTINQADVGNITVFAPDNSAFRSIGSSFSNLTSEDLRGILDYHIVRNVYYSTDLHNGTKIVTDDGQRNLSISTGANGTVFVNAAKVIVPNVLIANGVMHIVDNVLNPNNTSSPSASATAGAPGFTGSSASDQPFTSGQPTATTTINPTTNGAGAAASTAAGGSASKSKGLAAPRCTGAVEYAALAGAGAVAFAWGL